MPNNGTPDKNLEGCFDPAFLDPDYDPKNQGDHEEVSTEETTATPDERKESGACFDSDKRDLDFDSRIPDNVISYMIQKAVTTGKKGDLENWNDSFDPDSPANQKHK